MGPMKHRADSQNLKAPTNPCNITERKQCRNHIPHSERGLNIQPSLSLTNINKLTVFIHSWIYVFGFPARKCKSTSSDSKARDALSLFCLCQLCSHSCPVKCTLHPNTVSMVTHILDIDQHLRCACVLFSLLYLSSLWTVTSQQIRGFPFTASVAQTTFLSRQTLAQPYQRISQELHKAFLPCWYCCCYSSGCQPVSVYGWKQVHRQYYPLARNRSQCLYADKETP